MTRKDNIGDPKDIPAGLPAFERPHGSCTLITIAAAGRNNAIGKDNELLWHLPDDFRRFRKLTTGHHLIMGRKTFESFPKPLPKRHHLIITRDRKYNVDHEQCTVVHSLYDALKHVKQLDKAFIIGGGEIYRQAIPYSDLIELTRVHETFEADTFFPEIDEKDWDLISSEFHPKDDRHAHTFTYLTYKRRI